MTGPTLQSAVEELYSSPTAEFTARRKALSVAARSAGDRELAGQIAALRKPTLSADTLNRLVRDAPDAVDELLDLGAALRSAEKALDAATLRELTATRRSLVNDLAQLAFDITDQATPSASTRDEVVATLNAALADEQVAERLTSGALVTQARWDGFGSTSLPELAAVIPLLRARSSTTGAAARRPPTSTAHSDSEPSAVPQRTLGQVGETERVAGAGRTATDGQGAARRQTAADKAAADKAAADKAAAERSEAAALERRVEKERLRRLEAARAEADDADGAATAAAQEVADIDRRISELGLQIAHQRELLAVAQKTARSTEIRRRAATLALTRAGGRSSD